MALLNFAPAALRLVCDEVRVRQLVAGAAELVASHSDLAQGQITVLVERATPLEPASSEVTLVRVIDSHSRLLPPQIERSVASTEPGALGQLRAIALDVGGDLGASAVPRRRPPPPR